MQVVVLYKRVKFPFCPILGVNQKTWGGADQKIPNKSPINSKFGPFDRLWP